MGLPPSRPSSRFVRTSFFSTSSYRAWTASRWFGGCPPARSSRVLFSSRAETARPMSPSRSRHRFAASSARTSFRAPRSMRSSPDQRRFGLVVLAAGAAALGIAAESQGFAWSDTRSWVPDLLAGWTLAGLGVAASATGRPRGSSVLLFVSGVAWFIGDFHSTAPAWIGSLGSHLSWVFLAPLIQLALAYPSGRPGSRAMWAVVAAVWLTTATPWIDWNDDPALA